jgi:hypothetical protein
MILKPTRIEAKTFTYVAAERKFIAEISDFGKGFQFGRVYDDACDEGFTMVGQRDEVVFAVDHTEYDAEGDLLFWKLVSVTPKHKGFTAIVFND